MADSRRSDDRDEADLLSSLASLDISDGLTTSAATVLIDAFSPDTTSPSARAAAITALIKLADPPRNGDTPEVIGSDTSSHSHDAVLLPLLQRRLSEQDHAAVEAALRFLAALYAVLPSDAQAILARPEILASIDDWQTRTIPSSSKRDADRSGIHGTILATVDLFNAALSHKPSRSAFAADGQLRQRLHRAIINQGKVSEEKTVQATYGRAIAIAAGAAKFKLDMAADGGSSALGAVGTQGADPKRLMEQRAKQRQHDAARSREEDAQLLRLVREDLVARTSSGSAQLVAWKGEAAATTLLTTLECLTFLSLSPEKKDAVSRDATLLKALGSVLQLSSKRSVFPNRQQAPERSAGVGAATATSKSSYDLDPFRDEPELDRYNIALQFGLASILHNLTAYPAQLSDEEKQMQKLKKMANAEHAGADSTADDRERKRLESAEQVEARCSRVLDAGLVAVLVAIAVAGPPPRSLASTPASAPTAGVNPSGPIRSSVSGTLLSLLTKQDKVVRGKVVQQGGMKAISALSAPIYAALVSSAAGAGADPSTGPGLFADASTAPEAADLTPLQCLAKLVITSDPLVLFGSIASASTAVPLLTGLYVAPHASRLQHFEATLALTNLSSLSAQLAEAVARSHLSTPSENVAKVVEDRILQDDHPLTRRANVELLCNLLQAEGVFERWSGEQQAAKRDGEGKGKGRVRTRIHILLSLLSETLPTRLASAACLATLSNSPTTCGYVLTFQEATLRRLVRTLGVPLPARISAIEKDGDEQQDDDDDDGSEDEGAEEEDDEGQNTSLLPPSLPLHLEEAQAVRREINELGLALRGVSCLSNLFRYVLFLRDQRADGSAKEADECCSKLQATGAGEAVKLLLLREVTAMKASGGQQQQQQREGTAMRQAGAMVQELRNQVVSVAVETIKMGKQAGVVA